ncbi:helix-turn-helix transcriptional regulator [Amycolatopsis sp. H20-H5]|uniref:helix-turn-helix transcriptional regulator n=1 Tax=Amycolatopsis sp. H20-H5 TaxID=3046309 RepID=UPI002DBA1F92|nr:LuxR C-terminal-related transcriptional regulator [Amycolatopsis sp. H20-H5]MEC3973821.1 LuxR C-terminal-related transcriptional regulator [Amycolatopsis sp. H20-H5]
MAESWSDPLQVLDVVDRILSASRPELLHRFAREVGAVLPLRAAVMQTGDCPRSPLKSSGDETVTGMVTSAELQHLDALAEPGRAAVVEGVLGGVRRRLVLIASAPAVGNGAMVVLVPEEDEPGEFALGVAARLWNLVSVDAGHRALELEPELLAGNLAAATARAQAITDLGQTHATTLVTLLAILRSRQLADPAARRTATELAATALLDLRAVADRDQALSAESASAAFGVLTDQLGPLVRHTDVGLDLVGPEGERSLPQDIAHTARTVTRGLVLAALDRQGTRRIRAGWSVDGSMLRITVRDDAPEVDGGTPGHGLSERIAPLGGHWEVDAVRGWGTTVTAVLPLEVAEPPELRPLERLNSRELEVLAGISRGRRNRQIAEGLQLSEHTVKFHVRNLLEKLEVSSRGEAAALARDLRVVAS